MGENENDIIEATKTQIRNDVSRIKAGIDGHHIEPGTDIYQRYLGQLMAYERIYALLCGRGL